MTNIRVRVCTCVPKPIECTVMYIFLFNTQRHKTIHTYTAGLSLCAIYKFSEFRIFFLFPYIIFVNREYPGFRK